MTINKASSRNVLIQIFLLIMGISILVYMQQSILYALYAFDDESRLALILNGFIFALFIFGLFRIVMVLFEYSSEQEAVDQLIVHLRESRPNPTVGIKEKSLASRRYDQILWIDKQNSPINQGALAASLNASESTRLTLIRFVHNTLILSGVFGTVVSLSMALVGASGLLDSPESMHKMSAIIGGMSTALSTTISAIVCFIVYAYFYLRLNDVKIRLLSNIEDMTSLYILPRLTHSEETIIRDVAKLVTTLRIAADNLANVEQQFLTAGNHLQVVIDDMGQQVNAVNQEMNEMKTLIKRGFRLQD